ncbi:cereblon family protein [Pseudodesulfovibrio tunisiensis]|uniref:cereblon family protein n=1 Tax=Pseudodesulfovibrio tunisiensis TaxID=463192 RepID=UPI001FB1CA3D|nr:cereblon family protein [Pseudodesulfovibrio tunisiensis]
METTQTVLRELQTPPPGAGEVPRSDSGPDSGFGGVRLACRTCGTHITSDRSRIRVNGEHRHVFFNPHGLIFELGCFGAARNLRTQSALSTEFSWFAGHAWQIVVCAGCGSHMGWRFSGKDFWFYGLILAELVEVRNAAD